MKNNAIQEAIDNGLRHWEMDAAQRTAMVERILRKSEADVGSTSVLLRVSKHGLLLAAVLLTFTIAFASRNWGWINWNGEWETSNSMTMSTLTPNPTEADSEAAIQKELKVQQMFRTFAVPPGEYWALVGGVQGGIGRFGRMGERVETLSELAACFEGKNVVIPVPPDGYTLRQLETFYNELPLMESRSLYDTIEIDGYTLNKYRLREATADDLCGYEVEFVGTNGQNLYVSAMYARADEIESDDLDGAFSVGETDVFYPLQVEGFSYALMIRHADGTHEIHLRSDAENGYVALYSIFAQEAVDVATLFEKR